MCQDYFNVSVIENNLVQLNSGSRLESDMSMQESGRGKYFKP